jgi:hypothetical protein
VSFAFETAFPIDDVLFDGGQFGEGREETIGKPDVFFD